MPVADNLTSKQKAFIREYLKDGNGQEAMLRTGRTTDPDVARSVASRTLSNANVQETLKLALEKRGLTAAKLAEKIEAGLDATTTIHASKDGVITDTKALTDFQERRKMVELVAKLRGDLQDGLNLTVQQVLAVIPDEFGEDMAITPGEIIDVLPESGET